MRCKKAERLFLRQLDGRLAGDLRPSLDEHLRVCPDCSRRAAQHARIAQSLRPVSFPDPAPDLARRILPRLEPRTVPAFFPAWEKWGLRAVPVLLVVVAVIGLALALIAPFSEEQLTSTEILLLQNVNPMEEAWSLLEADKPDTRGLMLLVASIDEKPVPKKDRP